jgi:glutathione reductase (NADPH)
MTTSYDYDLVVIGGGSGGLAAAKRSAAYGKKVAVIERARLGGTCVNVGCVPKKIMFMTASMREMMLRDSPQYCFSPMDTVKLDWPALKKKRDAYIVKLNGIYGNGLQNANVASLTGDGVFCDDDTHTIEITQLDGSTSKVTAEKIVIAVGGRPALPVCPGIEHCISSDGFFDLEELPKKVVVVGAGYIAVELAGVLQGCGSETHLVIRKGKALRTFDDDVSNHLDSEMTHQGIIIHRNTDGVGSVVKHADGIMTVTTVSGEVIDGVNCVLMAPGRLPNTESLNLDKAGVALVPGKTYIQADEFQNTSNPHVFALGDVCGKVELTPMAIAAGRRLADRLYQVKPNAKASYDFVPTVVFSHPVIGTCGYSEAQAAQKYGASNLKIYKSTFPNLYYGIFAMESDEKPKTFMKMICAGEEELVVGLHVVGMGADEMMQGFGVAMKMGATKSDFDSCIAIHPTASEELVTMGTWGMAPEKTGAKHSPLGGASPAEPTIPKVL